MLTDEINFCPQCGTAVTSQERFGRLRPVCPSCGWIYFADPKVAVAVLLEQDGQVLLVRRAIDPKRGLWTLPAGFVDAGEDPAAAGVRECQEETGLDVIVDGLLDVIAGQEHPRGAHILIVYRAHNVGGELNPGDDVDQIQFFYPENLPALAFSSTQKILRHLKGGG